MCKISKQRYLPVFLIAFFVMTAPFPFVYLRGRIVSVWNENAVTGVLPVVTEAERYDSGTYEKERSFRFSDGNEFYIYRFEFDSDRPAENPYSKEVSLTGGDLRIRWQNYDEARAKWEFLTGAESIPKATLFIETGDEIMIISVPALYYNRFDHKTIENLPEHEKPVRIEKRPGGYAIFADYEPVEGTIGELWYYKSKLPLIEWSKVNDTILLAQDLHKERRFCFDGYYFRTYTTYKPYAENGFFRNPANFTGAQLMNNVSLGPLRNVGYAMTKICAENQNSMGFWETGPMSEWLNSDFGIQYDFYDTRFSTDYARSLLRGYEIFGDEDFLVRAVKYADFLLNFAERDGYKISDGAVLVPDYWGNVQTKKTHVSLNHQLCEINFLLELSIITGEDRYYDSAAQMLKGIELTENEWILEDKNLKYAILYDKSVNTMQDYPYLTYNDMVDTRVLLGKFGSRNPAIERLMASKKAWMDENNITGYKNIRE